jgi:hypothetical protein
MERAVQQLKATDMTGSFVNLDEVFSTFCYALGDASADQSYFILALTVGIALLVLVGLAGHSELGAGSSGSGMSAPVAPRSLVDSVPAAKILQSHFDWCEQILLPASFSLPWLYVLHIVEDRLRASWPTAMAPFTYVLHRISPRLA